MQQKLVTRPEKCKQASATYLTIGTALGDVVASNHLLQAEYPFGAANIYQLQARNNCTILNDNVYVDIAVSKPIDKFLTSDSVFRTLLAAGPKLSESNNFFLTQETPRPYTIREAARAQGFPDSFQFSGSTLEQYKQIGNAGILKILQMLICV